MSDFRLPSNTHRSAIMGRTGSGKTQFATWLLSHMNYDKQPWVIMDYKYDSLINAIPKIEEISLNKTPKKPGLYIVHPQPETDDEAVEAFLWNIWAQENTGVYSDEAYMVPHKGGAFTSLLTQGRSKHIPMINLTQRPAWITRFVFSESDFFGVFHLNDRRDQRRVEEFLPDNLEQRLPDYHSRWFDVNKNKIFLMQPVPEHGSILQRFDDRLKPKRSFF